MSITPELRAHARATYRSLLRAASTTFAGDDSILQAFRAKARAETLRGAAQTDAALFAANVQHAREVAAVLRNNVVQGVRVRSAADKGCGGRDASDVWRLRMTEHTELGSNDTIKTPGCTRVDSSESSARRTRKRERKSENDPAARSPAGPVPDTTASVPGLHYAALKRAHKERKVPELREADLEESFVRGGGPGGQSINKTYNNVQIIHKPSGIRVVCQETRSLSLNRMFARRILLEKLDKIVNPGLSKGELARAKQNERERRRRKKAKKKKLKNIDALADAKEGTVAQTEKIG